MTTVAYNYKDKEIAIDSRYTRGDIIDTDNGNKTIVKDGVTFVFAGESEGYQKLVDGWFIGSDMSEIKCVAFVSSGGDVYEYGIDNEGKESKELLKANASNGSGGIWALAAMDMGRTAKQAVQYAKTRDIYTGGKVRVIKVKP